MVIGEEAAMQLARSLEGLRHVTGRGGLREFIGRISKVRGIAYRDQDSPGLVRYTPSRPLIRDLDSIPSPARHLVPFEKYVVWDRRESAGIDNGQQRVHLRL